MPPWTQRSSQGSLVALREPSGVPRDSRCPPAIFRGSHGFSRQLSDSQRPPEPLRGSSRFSGGLIALQRFSGSSRCPRFSGATGESERLQGLSAVLGGSQRCAGIQRGALKGSLGLSGTPGNRLGPPWAQGSSRGSGGPRRPLWDPQGHPVPLGDFQSFPGSHSGRILVLSTGENNKKKLSLGRAFF